MHTLEAEGRLGLLAAGCRAIGLELSPEQEEQFARYARVMLEANTRVNLTSITEPDAVQTLHFLDSLTVAGALPESTLSCGRVLDVGSGAGFPGVPLKLVFPGIRLELLEATGKKTAFLRELIAELELPDVAVHTGRAEDLAHEASLRGAFDVVLARGVAKLAALVEVTLPFLRVGGVLVAHKSATADAEAIAAAKAVRVLGGGAARRAPGRRAGAGGRPEAGRRGEGRWNAQRVPTARGHAGKASHRRMKTESNRPSTSSGRTVRSLINLS